MRECIFSFKIKKKKNSHERLGTNPKDSSFEDKELEVILLKDFLVIELKNVDGENRENISPEVHQNTPVTSSKISNRCSRPPKRYSPALHYILLSDRGKPESYSKVVQDDESLSGSQP